MSGHHWLDILGVIKVQGDNLDIGYLKTWSQRLGLFGLLEKALNESGIKFKE